MSGLRHNLVKFAGALALFSVTACLKKPASDMASLDFPLRITGKIEDSQGLAAADIAVYIAQEEAPEILSSSDGSFLLTIDSERMSVLRAKYSPLGQPLHLYFVKSGVPGEAASYNQLQPISIGDLDLGIIKLEPQLAISGVVRAAKRLEQSPLPIEGAYVRVGRNAALTNIEGRFALYAPARNALPILITQKGYVQTQGTWHLSATADERAFVLYDRLSVDGQLAIPSSFRNNDPTIKNITLSLSANILSRWVRLALQEDELLDPNNTRAAWQHVESPIQVPLSAATPEAVFYQFADKDKKDLSPIYRLELNLAVFPGIDAPAVEPEAVQANETTAP